MNKATINTFAHKAFAFLAISALVLGMMPTQSFAVNADPNTQLIEICHATGSHNNPYETPNPSDTAKTVSGHDGHNPNNVVWYSGITTSWGDIIPPFTWYEKVGNGPDAVWEAREYPGKNWTTAGQAVWNNGDCNGVYTPPPTKGKLTVTKIVAGQGATAHPNDFNLKVDNIAVQSGVKNEFNPGSYTVSETNLPNYTAGVWSGDCSENGAITLQAGDDKSCTITNTYVEPQVYVCSDNIDNDGDGKVDHPADPGCDSPTDDNETDGGAPVQYGVIEVIKIVNGSDADESSFSYDIVRDINTAIVTDAAFSAAGKSHKVETGIYTVSENALGAGWTTTYTSSSNDPDDCENIVVTANATTTCTVTNTYSNGGGDPVLGCTNPLATNYNKAATPGNRLAEDCDFDYASVCTAPANLLTNGSFETPNPVANGGQWEIFASITGWAATNGIELWNNLLNGASEGVQNAELDTNAPTKITQSVAGLTPGATYELRFDFAARADSPTEANNHVAAVINGVELLNASTDNTNWTTYGDTFVATSTTANVSFADLGTADGYGTLVDNAVLCLVDDGEGNENPDEDTYRVYGYVWYDDNRNELWDGRFEEEGQEESSEDPENDLSGWVVRITNGEQSYETETDENGYYEFNVPAGTWTITEDVRDNWMRTTQESYVVEVGPVVTLLESVMSFIIPTAYAQVAPTYGEYNFGNDYRGGGGGNRAGDRDNDDDDGRVLGDSDSVEPEPLVLGEQVSAVPAGAPDAGAGGAAPKSVELFSLGSLAILSRSRKNV